MLITWNCLINKIKVITLKSEFHMALPMCEMKKKGGGSVRGVPPRTVWGDPPSRTVSVADSSGRRLIKTCRKSRSNDEAAAEVRDEGQTGSREKTHLSSLWLGSG